MDDLIDDVEKVVSRPTFLTVLCILTFIGSGWGVISSIAYQDDVLSRYASYYYWIIMFLHIGTIYGAIQMWQMKKTGLYIWTVFEALSVILMWVIVKAAMADYLDDVTMGVSDWAASGTKVLVKTAMNTMLVIGSFFPAVFVLLYWLNAKHLR